MHHPDPIQASFFDARPYAPEPEPTAEERFAAFHGRHPEVYRMLVQRARQAMVAGKRVGMRCLYENLRWHVVIERDEEYKLNDHYAPMYARLIMQREPDLAGFFETRGGNR